MALLVFHPVFAGALAMVPLIGMLFFFTRIFAPGAEYDVYKDQIRIAESRIAFGDSKAGPTVAVIGTITNSSNISWKEPSLHVDFVDAADQRIDVGTVVLYNLHLRAGETSSFKISFRREFAEGQYQKPQVRVVNAKDSRARF